MRDRHSDRVSGDPVPRTRNLLLGARGVDREWVGWPASARRVEHDYTTTMKGVDVERSAGRIV